MVPGTTTVTLLFWGVLFLLMECYFVQMTAEPGKAVAAIDT